MRPPIEELADLEAVLAVTHRDAHGVAIVRRASARIADLEHQLEIRKAAIDAQFKLMERVREMEKALRPFAEMDRPGCDLKELACSRGIASDMTIITSKDFRRAAEVLGL